STGRCPTQSASTNGWKTVLPASPYHSGVMVVSARSQAWCCGLTAAASNPASALASTTSFTPALANASASAPATAASWALSLVSSVGGAPAPPGAFASPWPQPAASPAPFGVGNGSSGL